MYTLLYKQLQFFHFTLSKIILMKFAKLRNFVLSSIMLLNLGAEGLYDNTSVGMCVSDQQKMDSYISLYINGVSVYLKSKHSLSFGLPFSTHVI